MSDYKNYDPSEFEFYPVTDASEFPEGERIFIEIDDEYIVIFNIDGNYFAIADLCSHDNGPLGDGEVEDYCIACPRHGARFDLRSGAALTLPAVHGIPSYPVRVNDGTLEIGFKKNE